MKIWLNTELVNAEEVELDEKFWPNGEGIFETLRTEDGQIHELSRHMRRAIDAANELGLILPNEEIIRNAVSQLLKEETQPVGRLRLMFSHKNFIAVHLAYEDIRKNQKLCISDQFVASEEFIIKRYPYTDRLEMLEKAKSNGFDEVVCINEKNEITEGAVSNFLFLIGSEWVTPPLQEYFPES
jgi:branched-chain amino acid aminotransferase